MYLETWLHNIIRNKCGLDQLDRKSVETYQLFKLYQILHYAYEKSSFYRDLFDKSGVKPGDVRTLNDLERLPFTVPHHLAETPYRFLCLSQSEIARPYSFITSGTTGPRKKIFWTQGDLERITDFMAAGMGTVAGTEDVVLILLPDGRPNSQADLLFKGVNKLGATPLVASVDLSAEEHLKIIENSGTTVVFGYTGRLFRLSKELQTKHDLSKKGVHTLFLAAEYLPNAMRQELQRMWDCRVHTHYGLTEMGLGVAVECIARDGYHFNEADLLLEIVNPQTGERTDEGEEGELVFTTLGREAMPLIRYRTHDISRLITGPCPCGAASLLKIDKVRKRLESIVRVSGGDEMYPTLFDDALFEIPGLIDYQVILARQKNRDLFDFKIEMACERPGLASEVTKKLFTVPMIERNVAAGRMLAPRVELVGWGALLPMSRAKKMIVDRRDA